MSEIPYEATLPAAAIFDPDYVDPDPDKQRFSEEIRRSTDEVVEIYGGYDRIDSLPTPAWGQLRQELLGIKIKLLPDGEVVHE
jgi:hypothetical protein